MKYKLKNAINSTDIVEQVCNNRGVDFKRIEEFLYPKKWVRSNPKIYTNLELIADTIIFVAKAKKKIGILIDSDCDGFLSAAMIVNYLREVLGVEEIRFYMHENKEHGLTSFIMNQIKEEPPELLIIPDASSNDWCQQAELSHMGIATVILDHHEAKGYSPFALIANNQLQEGVNKNLSAGGMVMKLLEMIDEKLNLNRALDYCDLAAVSLVGDCMLMNNVETRFYVQYGIMNINNPLLLELIRVEGERSYESISFDIAPAINAFIRIGEVTEKQELFLALIGDNRKKEISIRGQGKFILPLPEYISKMATRIKARQTTAVKKAIESKNAKLISNLPFTVFILDDETKKTLTGLIGNKLVDMYKKPAIVIRLLENGETYGGSGRTTDTFPNFKDYLRDIKFFNFCEGHQGAFGVNIDKESLEDMLVKLNDESLDGYEDCYLVDKVYENFVSAYDIMQISELNRYWSRGFDKPLFYIKLTDLESAKVEVIGQKRNTIRIKHNNITYLKFKCEPSEIEKIEQTNITEIEMVGFFNVNEYYDNLYPQVFIEDIEYKGTKKLNNSFFSFNFNNFNDVKW
ncbi:MAG: hypothetical protein HFJ13_11525 [Clostridium sp.]|jgi:single-stranded-DNA-specific exonuclease|uniref:DHH family phosphoesterase n=1 Tax=Clostridium sp. TaxID=1506 RepID=UPI0025B7D301|nr:DHH family phosphoesterase [Clostridium sp.]MCI9069872.1 hypothetical protein [Clostridium sp.]MCI9304721.1 hypothetical protein [Clostridium sp.]